MLYTRIHYIPYRSNVLYDISCCKRKRSQTSQSKHYSPFLSQLHFRYLCVTVVSNVMRSLLSGRCGRRWQGCSIGMIGMIGMVVLAVLYATAPNSDKVASVNGIRSRPLLHGSKVSFPPSMPHILLEKGLYSNSDLVNEDGIVPSFWNEKQHCINRTCAHVWGPCFPPTETCTWSSIIAEEGDVLKYSLKKLPTIHDDANFCRPGFLIIGQGKCGTSSLYHYLVGHPRVLPAYEKEIQYFKYRKHYGLRWYMSHFPTTKSFLAHGALMTGEASPGYMPYPEVAALIKAELNGTKIICVGRDPLGRSWSSYRYNYYNPAMEVMRSGNAEGIPPTRQMNTMNNSCTALKRC